MFGHSAGDLLLIEIAAPDARESSVPSEFLARQSGDEFLGLQMSGNHPMTPRLLPNALLRCSRNRFRSRAPAGHPHRVDRIFGFPDRYAKERDQVLSNAKLAMHRGKTKQRGSIYHVSARDGRWCPRPTRAFARPAECRRRNELELHYQLQTTLHDGNICGAEALMRWRHPKRGMISPAEFIPLAEESEAIIEMGEWALRTACRDAAEGKNSRNGRGQSVTGPVQPRQPGRDHPCDPARNRPVAEAA